MDIIKQIEEFIKEYNLSQAQIAKSINRSPGLLSSFMRGSYKHDTKSLEQDLLDFMESFKKSRAIQIARMAMAGIIFLRACMIARRGI
ncbi:hypothetical protein [Helicobacter suis]|uniref:hypothetical protein n=1 Tax=Helicobacter suis TaxID=104628 RepID=UPI0013D3DB31|nr:hypothetical protein [Helicobacter suis]